MLTPSEKRRLREEFWDPGKAVEVFRYALTRWCAEHDSVRAGLLALIGELRRRYPREETPRYKTLEKYFENKHHREPLLKNVVPVLRFLLW